MKSIKISTDRILLIIIIILLWFNALLKACESDIHTNPQPTITIVKDTVWQTRIDTLRIETAKLEYVYIPMSSSNTTEKLYKKKITSSKTKQFTEGK
ncbi:hypothetical protein [Kordia sp.]|uniref:hypothetical protein n=1 Tax=Kordia sp. TaxID=1965332 RepID=UPI003B5B272D